MTMGDILRNLFRSDVEMKTQRAISKFAVIELKYRICQRIRTEDYTCRLPIPPVDYASTFTDKEWHDALMGNPNPRVRYKLQWHLICSHDKPPEWVWR